MTARLTLEEARRAIYLDFEGRKNESPALLGTLWVPLRRSTPKFLQHALEPSLRTHALDGKLRFAPLRSRILAVLSRAQREDRMLVGWSSYEVKVVRRHCPSQALAFEEIYRDAKIVAKRWRSKLHPELNVHDTEWGPTHTLAKYERFLGIERPEDLGAKEMAESVKRLRKAAERYGSLDDAPASTLPHLEHLMEHNRYDCIDTREIALRVLTDLERPG
jgi:hypothetical protein